MFRSWEKELEDLDLSSKKHAIKISARLGSKKRLEIIDWAQKRNFKILNIGISAREMEEFEAMLESPIDELIEDEFEDSFEDDDE